MKVGRISFAVEVDDKPCFIILKDDVKDIALHLLSSLSDNGKLNVVKAPDNFSFEPITTTSPQA